MRMADRDGQRVGRVGGGDRAARQQPAHHHLHLLLVGMAGPDHRFLDEIGGILGDRQAAFFLSVSRPGPRTLLALDLELNENNPSNSMRLDQAEAFVQAVAQATGRLPVVYVHPTWANGDPLPNSGYSLDARITPDSILARCGLWVADYHDSPEVPLAWTASGWQLWQYAGDESAGRPAYGQTTIVRGVSHCDRNLFNGEAAALAQFWSAAN